MVGGRSSASGSDGSLKEPMRNVGKVDSIEPHVDLNMVSYRLSGLVWAERRQQDLERGWSIEEWGQTSLGMN